MQPVYHARYAGELAIHDGYAATSAVSYGASLSLPDHYAHYRAAPDASGSAYPRWDAAAMAGPSTLPGLQQPYSQPQIPPYDAAAPWSWYGDYDAPPWETVAPSDVTASPEPKPVAAPAPVAEAAESRDRKVRGRRGPVEAGEKPRRFVCPPEHCALPRAYIRGEHLKRHMLASFKNVACTYAASGCDKMFSRRDNMRQHAAGSRHAHDRIKAEQSPGPWPVPVRTLSAYNVSRRYTYSPSTGSG